jgi:Ca2+-transporting ATPase
VAPPARGLDSAEARRRLAEHGPNALPAPPAPAAWRRWLRQFESPLVYLLALAVAIDLAIWLYEGGAGAPVEAGIIALVLGLNAGLGVVQERRSEAALERLRELGAPQAWLLRDGALQQRPSLEIVPGDWVRVEAGERVPADGVVVEAHGLAVDESVLTGESLPVEKQPGGEALSGSLVVRGSAWVSVRETGPQSHMGRLAGEVGGIAMGSTPLERRLDAFGQRVAWWVVAIAGTVLAAGLLAQGLRALDEVLLFSVALAVSAVPEGLPAVVTLTLALGVQRMARRNAVVRRLQAVEALGSVTVIATDKTGTLTENRMTVRALEAVDEAEALVAMALANDCDPGSEAGDPIDRALLDHARARGVDVAELRAERPRRASQPFDSQWKYMRVTVAEGDRHVGYWKGASEVILDRSSLAPAEREEWARRAEASAAQGHRVLALASGDGDREQDLRFLALVSLWDPPRPETPEAVRAAQRAGVRVVMVTGDHPGTARAIAAAVGIAGAAGELVTGAELDALSADELREAARRASLFARVTPHHKLALIEALQSTGETVAVTGDGVNDAPALKRADVGVAMGRRGSDVAREVADLVLLDDDFASIVAAIREGRGIYANIQKFVRFLFSTNAGELALILAGTAGAWALGLREANGALLVPLTAAQILWINFLTDGPPALALGIDRNADLMERPPRSAASPLLEPASLRFVILAGGLKAAVGGCLLVALPQLGASLEATRTAVFLHTGLAQLAFAYPARRLGGATRRNVALHVSLGLAALLQLATAAFPPLRSALGLVALDPVPAVAVAAAVLVTWAFAEAIPFLERSRLAADAPTPTVGGAA